MISAQRQDAELFAFDVPHGLMPYLDAALTLGRGDIRQRPADLALSIRGLGFAEVIRELGDDTHGLLFHVARELAKIEPAAAWAGLQEAPSAWLGPNTCAVALPIDTVSGCPARFLAALPSLHPEYGVIACATRPESARTISYLSQAAVQEAWDQGRELQGVDARLCTLNLCAGSEMQELPTSAWEAFANANTSLLCGLLAGGCERLTDDAIAFARHRKSGGKPIAQHQAVALRLADIAMRQRALSLQTAVHSIAGDWLQSAYVPTTVAEVACDIACDALQTAGAHGYVDGLPFMRLHQSVHALAALLTAWSRHLRSKRESQ